MVISNSYPGVENDADYESRHFKAKLNGCAFRSKAVVLLLLLIYCLMYFPFFVGVLCLSLFCYALP